MKFEPFLTAPSTTDKNWIHYSKGGYNYCVEIENGSVLPDCTGFVWGLWRKRLGKKHNLSTRTAEKWYLNTADGYERGQTPKLGAVMCWSLGSTETAKDGCGHVASVEKINDDGSILVAESHWFEQESKRVRFKTTTILKTYKYGSLKFQGFIYMPIEWDEEKTNKYISGKVYQTKVILNVRSGAGTNSKIKTYNELTTNAKKNAYPPSSKYSGKLKIGTFITCLEVKNVGNDIWLRIPSGWVCAYCNGETYIE